MKHRSDWQDRTPDRNLSTSLSILPITNIKIAFLHFWPDDIKIHFLWKSKDYEMYSHLGDGEEKQKEEKYCLLALGVGDVN